MLFIQAEKKKHNTTLKQNKNKTEIVLAVLRIPIDIEFASNWMNSFLQLKVDATEPYVIQFLQQNIIQQIWLGQFIMQCSSPSQYSILHLNHIRCWNLLLNVFLFVRLTIQSVSCNTSCEWCNDFEWRLRFEVEIRFQ